MKKNSSICVLSMILLVSCSAPINSNDISKNNKTYFESVDEEPTNYFLDNNPKRISSNFGQDASSEMMISWQVSKDVSYQNLKLIKKGETFDNAKVITLTPQNDVSVSRFIDVSNDNVITSTDNTMSGTMTLWGMSNNKVNASSHLDRYVCQVKLSNLEKGTTYYYTVGTNDNYSSICSFKTALGDGDFQYTVYSDPQDSNAEYLNTSIISENILNNNSDFFAVLGDISDLGEYELYYNNYFETQKECLSNMPISTIPGNHETLLFDSLPYSYVEYNGECRTYNSNFYNPQNGPTDLTDYNSNIVDRNSSYYYIYNDALFIYINTQYDSSNLKKIASWVDNVIETNPTKYIVCSMHKGAYGNYYYGKMSTFLSIFSPVFEKHSVDLVMSGHDHTWARTAPLQNNKLVDYEGNGTTYLIVASPGPKFNEPDAYAGSQFVKRNDEKLTEGIYSNIMFTDSGIKVEAYTLSNKLYDSFFIPAKRDSDGNKLANDRALSIDVDSYGSYAILEVNTNLNDVVSIQLEKQDETIIAKTDREHSYFELNDLRSNSSYPYQIRVTYNDNVSLVTRFDVETNSFVNIDNNNLSLNKIINDANKYKVYANSTLIGVYSLDEYCSLNNLFSGNYCITVEQLNDDKILAYDKVYYKK